MRLSFLVALSACSPAVDPAPDATAPDVPLADSGPEPVVVVDTSTPARPAADTDAADDATRDTGATVVDSDTAVAGVDDPVETGPDTARECDTGYELFALHAIGYSVAWPDDESDLLSRCTNLMFAPCSTPDGRVYTKWWRPGEGYEIGWYDATTGALVAHGWFDDQSNACGRVYGEIAGARLLNCASTDRGRKLGLCDSGEVTDTNLAP